MRGQITLNLTIWAKKVSGIRKREDPVFRVFYHIKYRREKFGADEIVRFHGDSGIERIWFRGFLLYCDDIIHSCASRPLAIVCTISVYFVLAMLMLPLTGPYAFCK